MCPRLSSQCFGPLLFPLITVNVLQEYLCIIAEVLFLENVISDNCTAMGDMREVRSVYECWARKGVFRVCTGGVFFLLLIVALLPTTTGATGVDKRIWGAGASKLSGLIIPGFASTRLRAWAMLDCPYSPLDFSPLDPVWIDVRKV